MPSNDAFTLSLLTNAEVLKMHREGTNVKQLFQKDGKVAVTSKNPKDGSIYLALFNISDRDLKEVSVRLADLGIKNAEITNMWTGKKVGTVKDEVVVSLKEHASVLYKLKAKK